MLKPNARPFEDDKFYSAAQIAQKFSIHKITPWRWVKSGRLPKPHKIARGTTRWLGSELNAALLATAESRS